MANKLKIGKTSFNLEGFKGMKKDEFLKIYKKTKLFNAEKAWTEIQEKLKEA